MAISNIFIYHFMSVVCSYFFLFCPLPFLVLGMYMFLATWISSSSLLRVCKNYVCSISKCVLSKALLWVKSMNFSDGIEGCLGHTGPVWKICGLQKSAILLYSLNFCSVVLSSLIWSCLRGGLYCGLFLEIPNYQIF